MTSSISVVTRNCDKKSWYLVEKSADSEIEIELRFDKIVTVQSRNQRKEELCNLIQHELKGFSWIICGSVNIEFAWYLHATERQETDKVGDLDNITKPILDSLVGECGLLVDDAQVGSLHTFWMSRNEQVEDNIVRLFIRFNNDECLEKKNLTFVQYSAATCLPLNIDFNQAKDMFAGILVIKARLKHREAAETIRRMGGNVDRMLVVSTWDFHRTRLSSMNASRILSLESFKQKCFDNGLTWKKLRRLMRSVRKSA